jgi:hypothetical protein
VIVHKRPGTKFIAAFDVPLKLERDGDRIKVKAKGSGRLLAFLTKLGIVKIEK